MKYVTNLLKRIRRKLSEYGWERSMSDREMNEKVYMEQAEQLRRFYPEEYIALVKGKVVAHSKDLSELLKLLDEIEPDRSKGLIVDTSIDYTKRTNIL